MWDLVTHLSFSIKCLWPLWRCPLAPSNFQGDLGPGSLALREGVASCWTWGPSILPTLRRSGLRGGYHWLSFLLSQRRFRATGSSRRAGAFREEVCIAWDDFWASVKCSAKPSTAGPNRLPDETGASRKGTLSTSFISVIVSQRWRSNTTRLDIYRPMACAVALVSCRARSVALLRSLSEAASRLASSLVSILVWKTWSTAIECSTEAACPAAE